MKRLRYLLSMVTLASLAVAESTFAQPRFEIPLTITDGNLSWSMHFGIFPGANYCMADRDTMNGHGEWEPTPAPPGPLEAWFVWPRSGSSITCFGLGIRNDYRPFASYAQKDTFRVNMQYILDSTHLVVSWPSGLGAYFNDLILKDVQTGGALHTIDMLTTTSVNVSAAGPPSFRIYASGPHNPQDTVAVNVQILPGWNMVSNPVITANDSISFLFPTCIGCPLWPPFPPYFDCRLPPGEGAWIKCPGGGPVTITGMSIEVDTIPVTRGWNLIGSISYPVAVSSIISIPVGNRVSDLFGYLGGYFVTNSIQPGRGYWVKMNSAGWIVLRRTP